jgi:membrane protease YdiL (CAAX protease family)
MEDSGAMVFTVAVAGLLAEMGAWWLVARGRNIWRTMPPVLGLMGLAALLIGPPAWSPDVSAGASIVLGVTAGVALYVATREAIIVIGRWEPFRRQSLEMYRKQGGLSLAAALALSIAISVPGEELFWRGLVQGELTAALDGSGAAPVIAWAAFVLANLPSGNLAIAAGAVVGGGAWVALAWWSGGVLAPLACHVVWTGLMIGVPVVHETDRSAP